MKFLFTFHTFQVALAKRFFYGMLVSTRKGNAKIGRRPVECGQYGFV